MYFQIYRAKDGWRWRLKAGNHEVIAQGEAYKEKADCLHGIALVKKAATAEIKEVTV